MPTPRASVRSTTSLARGTSVASCLLLGAVTVITPRSATAEPMAPSGQVCFGVDGSDGDAAIVNLTPVEAAVEGFGLLISSDIKSDPPVASNVNYAPGAIDPNVAAAAIGADGQVCYQNSHHTPVELVADHLGSIDGAAYTAATNTGAPDRKVDTREELGGTTLAADGQLCFDVDGEPGDAAVVNLTPVNVVAGGFGLLISSDIKANPPVASNTNYAPGAIDPNVAVAIIGADGQVCYQNSEHGPIDLVADHLGSIDAAVYTPATPTGAPDRKIDTRDGLPQPPRVVRPECAMPTTTTYSTVTAHHMFGLSSRAYEVEPGVAVRGERLDDIGSAVVHFPTQMACWELLAALRGGHAVLGPVTDTEVIIARNVDTDDIVVSFRGTELDPVDFITDASATRVAWPVAGRGMISNAVHSGFGGAYLAVRDQLLLVLASDELADGDGTRVYFTGHSLGGALATIASIDLVDDLMAYGYERTEIGAYTFGAPRSMSREMVGHHRSLVPNAHAVASPNDPVPHVPTAIGNTNPYAHLSSMVVLNGVDGTRSVRRDFGDGRDYGGCAHLLPDFGDHGRAEYDRRVGATRYYGSPIVWAESVTDPVVGVLGKPNLRFHWSTPIEGPCDQAAAWNRSSRPTSVAGAVSDRYVFLDGNDQHTTLTNYEDANWVGYISIFGDVITAVKYR